MTSRFEIMKVGTDKYHSLLYEYDTANRRKKYSDPEFGHYCADTSGWPDNTEDHSETNWVDTEPQRYLYGMKGGLEATGRVAGKEIMGPEGEPYFVKRDEIGRVAKVIYPDKTSTKKPETEIHYQYSGNGAVKQIAMVTMGDADTGKYGPEDYVIQFHYDDVGRLVRKVVRDNAKQDTISTRSEMKYEFDGRGISLQSFQHLLPFNNTLKQLIRDTPHEFFIELKHDSFCCFFHLGE